MIRKILMHSSTAFRGRGGLLATVGRPEADQARQLAMAELGNGLHDAKRHEEALSVQEAVLSMDQRLGVPELNILVTKGNLARTYAMSGRLEEALQMRRDVYSGFLRLIGEERDNTISSAINLASALHRLKRFEEAKDLMRKTLPVARRTLGESHTLTLQVSWNYARALYEDPAATLEDLREAVTTLEETSRTARRILGSEHPTTKTIEWHFKKAQAALRAREEA